MDAILLGFVLVFGGARHFTLCVLLKVNEKGYLCCESTLSFLDQEGDYSGEGS